MEKTIDYLEEISTFLWRLAQMCFSLSCAQDEDSGLSEDVRAASYNALCDILEAKSKEIDRVVSTFHKA